MPAPRHAAVVKAELRRAIVAELWAERLVSSGEQEFRRRDDAERLRDVIRCRWEMDSAADGSVAGVGLEFLVIDANGRICGDYQFIES